jgi:hypothetical protein
MAWPPGWDLCAAWQRAGMQGPIGGLTVLEDWRDNYVTPWGQRVDSRLQDQGNRIRGLERHRERDVDPLLSRIPGMENRIGALEGTMSKVEKKCRKNGKDVNNFDKKMNQVIEEIEKLPEKLGQQCGGLGGGFGGGEYTNGQNASQQGFINMIHQQQQLGPVMPWSGFAPPPPAPAPASATAPAPSYGCRVYNSPCIHINMSPMTSRRK